MSKKESKPFPTHHLKKSFDKNSDDWIFAIPWIIAVIILVLIITEKLK